MLISKNILAQVLEDLEVDDDLDQLDSLQILHILQKISAKKLVQRNGLFEEFMFAIVPWKPIVDGDFASDPFIPDDPKLLLAEGNFNKVPIITGGNQDEGSFYITQVSNFGTLIIGGCEGGHFGGCEKFSS